MENMTRQELLDFIKSKEDELAELRSLSANGEFVPLGKMHELEDEIEEAESELEKIAELEGDYDSGTNFSDAQIEYEEDKENEELMYQVNESEITNNSDNEEKDQEANSGDNEQENELDENISNDYEEDIPLEDGKTRLTLTQWQLRTGIEIIPDDYIRRKSDKFLTEEDFKEILVNENVPKIIQEPGSAEKYLKTVEEWDSVRTSKSALEQAILNGNFPVDVNDESYILLQYDKDTVRDYDYDKEDPSYAVIDKKDIYGALGEDKIEDEQENEINREENEMEENSILSELEQHFINGRPTVSGKQALELTKKAMIVSMANEAVGEFAASLVNKNLDVAEVVGKSAFDKISRAMGYDIENPDITDIEPEREEEDFGEITPPPTV